MENDLILSAISKTDLLKELGALIEEKLRAANGGTSQDKLLSRSEACKMFEPNISTVTLDKWAADGLIPSQKIGGRVWFKYSDLIEAGSRLKRYKNKG